MQFIPDFLGGTNRHQMFFSTLEEQVAGDNPARLTNAFADRLELKKPGFTNTIHKSEGRPPYAPDVLLKLYLCGYLNKIRNSGKLERERSRNEPLKAAGIAKNGLFGFYRGFLTI